MRELQRLYARPRSDPTRPAGLGLEEEQAVPEVLRSGTLSLGPKVRAGQALAQAIGR
ncbi:MAG TPA: hypothetical protein VHS55_07060 [Solirubrobacteraceae bacterium]|nr:hypothetical protein [Solirubrobacteraceae bacterium]